MPHIEFTVHACIFKHAAGQGYDLGFGLWPGTAYKLGAELPEFPEPALLGTFVPETVVEVVEFDWLWCTLEFVDVHPDHWSGEFRTKGHLPVTFVLEIVYLAQDAFA